MRLLVLGGTVFLGRHVVAEALEQGWEVSVFTRGLHGHPPAGVEHIVGDRRGELDVLRDREWDVAVDTSGFEAEHVGATAALLADSVERYAFVSSVSVYRDWPEKPVDEGSPTVDSGRVMGRRREHVSVPQNRRCQAGSPMSGQV